MLFRSSPRNKILATSLLVEAFLYEEQTRRSVSIKEGRGVAIAPFLRTRRPELSEFCRHPICIAP